MCSDGVLTVVEWQSEAGAFQSHDQPRATEGWRENKRRGGGGTMKKDGQGQGLVKEEEDDGNESEKVGRSQRNSGLIYKRCRREIVCVLE